MLLCCGAYGWAQPGTNPPAPDPKLASALGFLRMMDQGQVITKTTPTGILLISAGVIVKLDPTTLDEKGMLELFGPRLPWSEEKLATLDPGVAFLAERVRRLYYPVTAVVGDNLLVIMGEYYFRVDLPTLTLKATSIIETPEPLGELARLLRPEGGEKSTFSPLYLFQPTAQVEVTGQQALLARNGQIFAIRIADGKVQGRKPLPVKLTERLFPGDRAGKAPVVNQPIIHAVEGKEFSAIGRLTRQELHGVVVWSLHEEGGAEYALAGALGNITEWAGARLLALGAYHQQPAGLPPFGNGYLEVTAFTPLPIAEVK